MKKSTAQIIRSVVSADPTIRPDLGKSALSLLNEKGSSGIKLQLLSQAQVAYRWSCSRATVFRMTKEGKLPYVEIRGLRRYRLDTIERIEKGEV